MPENPLRKLRDLGQSVWLDYIDRSILQSGRFARLMRQDGLSGVTSNPKIFHDAITGSDLYDEQIHGAADRGDSAQAIYDEIAIRDVGTAADLLRPVYQETGKRDGYVSIEVSPLFAHDTEATIEQGREYWKKLNRPNILIKVPATQEGLPAIRRLIADGINVNVTLLFGIERYNQVVEVYLSGIEARLSEGATVDEVFSVASFFLSRIDVLVDPLLEETMKRGGEEATIAERLHGEVAIASAKTAYLGSRMHFTSQRFRDVAERGARPQKLLWASTGTKNPAYSDVKYIEPLIGPDTINTMPEETLDAYRDHGVPASRLDEGAAEARTVFEELARIGIDPRWISEELEGQGVKKFADPYDKLLAALEAKSSPAAHSLNLIPRR